MIQKGLIKRSECNIHNKLAAWYNKLQMVQYIHVHHIFCNI